MPLEPDPSQCSPSIYNFLTLFQWPKMWQLPTGKQLSLCLHELHQPRVQQLWGAGEGSMAGLHHSACHCVPESPFWPFPCPAWSHSATCLASLSKTHLVQAAGCCNLSAGSRRPPGSSGTLQNRAKHSPKYLPVGPAVKTSPPRVHSSLPRAWQQRTRPFQLSTDSGGREPQERWHFRLLTPPCSNPSNQISKRMKTNRGCSQWCITFSVLSSTFYRSLLGQWNITRRSFATSPSHPFFKFENRYLLPS